MVVRAPYYILAVFLLFKRHNTLLSKHVMIYTRLQFSQTGGCVLLLVRNKKKTPHICDKDTILLQNIVRWVSHEK